jgi:hypothetical protein
MLALQWSLRAMRGRRRKRSSSGPSATFGEAPDNQVDASIMFRYITRIN